MDFTDLRVWAAAIIVLQFVIGALNWIGRKSFATTETLLAVNKVAQDQLDESDRKITSAHHRIELLEEKLKGLPDYDVINEIKEEIGQVQQTQASGNTELRLLREQLQRMDDFLRSSK